VLAPPDECGKQCPSPSPKLGGGLVPEVCFRLRAGGKPHRIISSTRSSSREVRTPGASISGKMPGSGGMLPVVSRETLNRFADRVLVLGHAVEVAHGRCLA